jgi:hypothetical protein
MDSLGTVELLGVWERGLDQPPVQRALELLTAACPETSAEELSRLGIGRRDRLLLELRGCTFGDELVLVAPCGECGERLEVELGVSELLGREAGERQIGKREPTSDNGEPAALTLATDGWEVRFRLPHSQDLVDLAGSEDADEARRRLIAACLIAARRPSGKRASAGSLPVALLEAISARMAEADPMADVELVLTCPACGHALPATFDIVSFFWTEIDVWARFLLREVHLLASAYGWHECDILALGPRRRRAYLEMVAR